MTKTNFRLLSALLLSVFVGVSGPTASARTEFDTFFFDGGSLYYKSIKQNYLEHWGSIDIHLYDFLDKGNFRALKGGNVVCDAFLNFYMATQRNTERDNKSTAVYKFIPYDDDADCPIVEEVTLISNGSMNVVSFAIGEAVVEVRLDRVKTERLLDFAQGACGSASWAGVVHNPVDMFLCDVNRAITEFEKGRVFRISPDAPAQIRYRGGKKSSFLKLPSSTEARTFERVGKRNETGMPQRDITFYEVVCVFDENTGAKLRDGAVGHYVAKLRSYSEQRIVFDCEMINPWTDLQ